MLRCRALLLVYVFFFGSTLCCFGQTHYYSENWKKIDTLLNQKDLPKSALAQVNLIYSNAKDNNDDAEMIKALVCKLSLQQAIQEKNIDSVMKDLHQQTINARNAVVKSLLLTLQATTLKQYLQANYWFIKGRKNISSSVSASITTWGVNEFFTVISGLLDEALVPATVLQTSAVKDYRAIILQGNTPFLRTSMYDLLVHYQIAFYSDLVWVANRNTNSFVLSNKGVLATANEFVDEHFNVDAGTHPLAKVLSLYQALLKSKLANKEQVADFIDVDLSRLKFGYEILQYPGKDSLYVVALQTLLQQYVVSVYGR